MRHNVVAYPAHYYPERNLYHNFAYEKHEKNESFWRTSCMWTLACIVCLLVVALAIFLIIFFTWGPVFSVKYNAENTEKESTNFRKAFLETDPNQIAVRPPNDNRTSSVIYPKIVDDFDNQKSTSVLHFDLDLPSFVLNALKIGQPKICILDTSYALTSNGESLTTLNYETYSKEHLPFAKFFDINKVVKYTDNGVAQLAHPLQFQDYCRSLNVDNDCHVVLYDRSFETSRSICSATFVWWLFRLYGHPKVTVMNGGLEEWKKQTVDEPDYRVVSDEQKHDSDQSTNDFVSNWRPDVLVDYQDLSLNLRSKESKYSILDTRSQEEFNGISKNGRADSYGKIRTAKNVPLVDNVVTKDGGALKSVQEIKKWLVKNVQVEPGSSSTVVYDNMPMNASILYFALIQLGYDARVYNGGWIEWARRAPLSLKENYRGSFKFLE